MDIQCHIRSFGRPETAATNQSDNLVALRGTIPFGHLGMSITVVRERDFRRNRLFQWIGLLRNLQETTDFTIKYGAFL